VGRRKLPKIENVEITDIATQGKGLARIDNFVTFVKNALPGDVVDLQILRRKKSYQEARAVHFHTRSDKRTDPFCNHFGVCGGCKWQDLAYEHQLAYKQQEVVETLKRIGHIDVPDPEPIIAAAENRFYRNKLEYTFSNKRWLSEEEISSGKEIAVRNGLGFHIPGLFDKVVNVEKCFLQGDPSNSIRNAIRQFAEENNLSFFDLKIQEGLLRTLIIRTASTGDVMVLVVFYDDDKNSRDSLLSYLGKSFPEITSLMYSINQKGNDATYDLEFIQYSGKDHIIEKLEDLQFKIGPKSFFQTNTAQALRLYQTVRDFADLQGTETVYDLYTGTGTIANFVAGGAKKVVGIEHIPEAIKDAKTNSKLNQISNTYFFSGDIQEVLDEEFVKKEGKPDVLITDPPRAGMHQNVVKTILSIGPEKIVYVSCNPATQARDIELLSEKYKLVRFQPVDMFPHTYHVENVALLQKM
jgi:23S rRNA (uracil1939-C5)-methyltransferase